MACTPGSQTTQAGISTERPSALEILIQIREHCPEVFERCEVIVDEGIRRGTDVVKALCLGAKPVGLGRSFLYSLVFGKMGVSRAIKILRQEIQTTMVLVGVTGVDQLGLEYVQLLDGMSLHKVSSEIHGTSVTALKARL